MMETYNICFGYGGMLVSVGRCMLYVWDVGVPGWEAVLKVRLRDEIGRGVSCVGGKGEGGVVGVGGWGGEIVIVDWQGGVVGGVEGLAGVTQVEFCGDFGVVSAERNGGVKVWDLRRLVEPVWCFERDANTRMRIGFDVWEEGRRLVVGSRCGTVRFYGLDDGMVVKEFCTGDVVNGVGVHPIVGDDVVVTTSGERRMGLQLSDSDSDSDKERQVIEKKPSMKIWSNRLHAP